MNQLWGDEKVWFDYDYDYVFFFAYFFQASAILTEKTDNIYYKDLFNCDNTLVFLEPADNY